MEPFLAQSGGCFGLMGGACVLIRPGRFQLFRFLIAALIADRLRPG